MMGHKDLSEHASVHDYAVKHVQYGAKPGTRKWAKRIANKMVRKQLVDINKEVCDG